MVMNALIVTSGNMFKGRYIQCQMSKEFLVGTVSLRNGISLEMRISDASDLQGLQGPKPDQDK